MPAPQADMAPRNCRRPGSTSISVRPPTRRGVFVPMRSIWA